MASIIRSDISRSTRLFDGRAGSPASVVDRLINDKQVTQLSAVIGNGARDSALQINGHVTDKISNLNFKYLIIPCHCEVVRAVASNRVGRPLPAVVPVKPPPPARAKRPTHSNIVGTAEISSLRRDKRNMTVLSKATGHPDTFCVIFPRRVQDNFISLEIVNRLGLETRFDTAMKSSITWDLKRLSSTGDFVDLSFSQPGSAKSMARRFHVVEDCPFDMLVGTAVAHPFLY